MASKYLRGKTWRICWRENGKTFDRSLKTRDAKIAEYRKKEIELRLTRQQSPIPYIDIPVAEVYKEYMQNLENRVQPNTFINYQCVYDRFFNDAKIPRIKDITEKTVYDYLRQRFDTDKISNSTANHIIRYLKALLNYAVKRNYLAENPLKNMKRYPEAVLPPKFLTREQLGAVLEASKGETLYPAIATAIYTGMRLGELQRFRMEDVDFKKNTITVPVAKSRKFRVIPLHPDLKRILEKHPKFEWANRRRVFRRIMKRAKIGPFGWHTLRHSFASLLVQEGVSLYKVSKYLGHHSIVMTERYSHLIPDNEDIARISL